MAGISGGPKVNQFRISRKSRSGHELRYPKPDGMDSVPKTFAYICFERIVSQPYIGRLNRHALAYFNEYISYLCIHKIVTFYEDKTNHGGRIGTFRLNRDLYCRRTGKKPETESGYRTFLQRDPVCQKYFLRQGQRPDGETGLRPAVRTPGCIG